MDAFERIYEAMRKAGGEAAREGAVRIRRGKVLTPLPLSVDVGGTTQEAARFYLCSRLTQGHAETLSLKGGAGGFFANGGTHAVSLDAGSCWYAAESRRSDSGSAGDSSGTSCVGIYHPV